MGEAFFSLSSLLNLKLVKVLVWHLGLYVAVLVAVNVRIGNAVVTDGVGTSVAALRFLVLYFLQAVFLALHFVAASRSEASPLVLPPLIWSSRSLVWIRLFRTQYLFSYLRIAAVLSLCCLSGFAAAFLHSRKQGLEALIWSLTSGSCQCLVFGTYYVFRSVLGHPSIQRTTFFRIKQRLPALFKHTLILSTLSVLSASAICYVAAFLRGASSAAAFPEFKAALQSVAGWMLAVDLLEIVATEPLLPLLDRVPAQAIAQLKGAASSPIPLLQELALMELALVAEDRGPTRSAIRRAVFEDDSGAAAWAPLAAAALGEVRDSACAISAALPSMAGDAGKKVIQWNVVQLASLGKNSATLQQFSALLHVRSRYQRLAFSARFLAGMLVAAGPSYGEDRYSVVLMRDPKLADVVLCLASCLLAVQQFNRSTGSIAVRAFAVASGMSGANSRLRSSSHATDCSTVALEDVLRRLLVQVCLSYGPKVQTVCRDAKLKPPHGSLPEVASLLKGAEALAE